MEAENIAEHSKQKIYVWGSAECDQFMAKDEDGEEIFEVNKPYHITELDFKQITKIACGGLHSLILTNQGIVYSFGCDDKGVLGREGTEEEAKIPKPITDIQPVDMIACGGSHSIAANSKTGAVYFWGFYVNTKGPIGIPIEKPKKVDNIDEPIKKILCGQNHTMVLLVSQKLLTWGDQETLVIGRKSETRRALQQTLNPQPIGMRKPIIDIYTGASHAFIKVELKNKKHAIFGWGLNNQGQLGIGSFENQQLPYEIEYFNDIEVADIQGGEHHTIVLDKDGNVYAMGLNDEGQLGVGEEFNEKLRMEAEVERKEQEEKEQKQQLKKQKKSKKLQQEQSELLTVQKSEKVVGYERIPVPMKIESLSKIEQILAASHYNYAISNKGTQIFSWGLGSNFVLGTRNETTQFKPKDVSKNFVNQIVLSMSLGSNHVLAYTSEDPNFQIPQINENIIATQEAKVKQHKRKIKQSQSKSRELSISQKRSEPKFDESLIPVKDLKIE